MRTFRLQIGQYYPGDTLAYRIDPRIKIILVFIFITALFLIGNLLGFGLNFILLTAIILLSKIPLKWAWITLKPLRLIIIFAFLMHVFFTSSGRIIFSFGPVTIFDQGIIDGVITSARLILLVLGTTLLTLTTTPIELTDALESLLGFLKTIKVPVHEIAMMMALALRFIPILLIESERIMKAQASRGADYDSGNPIERAKNFISLLIPLLVSIFRRADELAIAMDARCYKGGEKRTRMRNLRICPVDVSAFVFLSFILVGLSLLGRI